jgi:hypothetical protein
VPVSGSGGIVNQDDAWPAVLDYDEQPVRPYLLVKRNAGRSSPQHGEERADPLRTWSLEDRHAELTSATALLSAVAATLLLLQKKLTRQLAHLVRHLRKCKALADTVS